MNIISTVGYGHSGSSAVLDLLKEIDNIHVINAEADFIRRSGGFYDIGEKFKSRNKATFNKAIRDFYLLIDFFYKEYINEICNKSEIEEFRNICNNFIENITSLKIKTKIEASLFGNGHVANSKIINHFKNIIELRCNFKKKPKIIRELLRIKSQIYRFLLSKKTYDEEIFLHKFLYLQKDISYQEYLKIAQESIESLIKALLDKNIEKKYIALDQILPDTLKHTLHCLEYFNDIKIISVYRDPRDSYVQSLDLNAEWMFSNTVENFIDFYRYNNFLEIDDKRVLHIRFEDLVVNYDKTTKIIYDFLNISKDNNIYQKKYFNPEESKKI